MIEARLPLRRALGALICWTLLAAGCDAAPPAEGADRPEGSTLRGVVPAERPDRPDFAMRDTDGRPYDFREATHGKLALLFVGYTYCPDICPVHLANLGAAIGDLPAAARDRIEVVFVSADPARDTPARIRTWLDAFHRDFVGLSGSIDEVNAILADLGLPPATLGEPDENGAYAVGHPAHIIAFPPDGGPARAYYGFGTRQTDWLHDLPRLLEDTLIVASGSVSTEAVRSPNRAIVALPPAGDGPAALYVTVTNPYREADALVGASSPIADRVTLHGYAHDGVRGDDARQTTIMRPVAALDIEAGGSVRMAPGGHHLMLEGLRRTITTGDTFTVELRFRSGRRVENGALVVPYSMIDGLVAADEAKP